MLSLAQFRANCFPLFKVLSSSHMVLEVVHKGKVYDVTIALTEKEPKLTRPKRKVTPKVLQVTTDVCPECGALAFNNICMNRQCIHSKGSLLEAKAQTQRPQLPKAE